jgi:hypothetical protein
LAGTILRLQSQHAKCMAQAEVINAKIALVERDLLGIDLTLPQHEIKVEPKSIRPVKPHRRKPLVRHGQLGRLLLKILRSHDDWLATQSRVLPS